MNIQPNSKEKDTTAGIVRLQRCRPAMEMRARLLKSARDFFHQRGFLEVETPVRIAVPALEQHIDAIPSGPAWLRTSPELHMKRLLAAGYGNIFQIGPCFRQDEYGNIHNPEFCMLEWYRVNADYRDILVETRDLINTAAHEVLGHTRLDYRGQCIDLQAEWYCHTVAQVFMETAGWDPTRDFDPDRFDLDLVNKIEPQLPKDKPAVLMDYPEQQAALARCRPGNPPVAERWELYIGGLEIANAFTELTDPGEQRRRFEICAAQRRAAGKTVYAPDQNFLAALDYGLPPSAGIALGIDRLVMLFCGAASLDDILPFRMGKK